MGVGQIVGPLEGPTQRRIATANLLLQKKKGGGRTNVTGWVPQSSVVTGLVGGP